ncbi:hypothetical protein ANN_00524 [Periplaneta americana]|uniref:Gustatory receptor n=1 Tax=Periplaneta americana TaxID=6978 RepID=A0ABQ8TR86_PERAM|nr:hypothetical protein ANN_00524 [Periplaneta americana]
MITFTNTKGVYFSLQPALSVFKFFGYAGFGKRTSYFKYCGLCWSLLCIVLYCVVVVFLISFEVNKNYPARLKYVVYLRAVMMTLSAIMTTVWFISSRRKLITKLIDDLSDVDLILYIERERCRFYRARKRHTLLQLILHIAALQIPIAVYFTVSFAIGNIIKYIAIDLCTCSNMVMIILFMNLVLNLRCRYIHLNSLIMKLDTQIFSTLDSSDRLNCVGIPVFTIKKASENFEVKTPKGLLHQITTFKLIYTELYGVARLINLAFGFPLLIAFFWIFVSLINTLFVLLMTVIRGKAVGIYLKYAIASAILGLMKIMLLTEICLCCHMTKTESKKSLVLVRKLLLRHGLNDVVMNELERFANYIKDMRPKFTACDNTCNRVTVAVCIWTYFWHSRMLYVVSNGFNNNGLVAGIHYWAFRCRYIHLNSLIMKLNSQIFTTQDSSDRLSCVGVPVFTITKANENFLVKKPKGLLHQITSFRLICTELYGISSLINLAFGLPLLISFFWMFVSLMNTLFVLLTNAIRGKAVGIYMKYVLGCSIVGVMQVLLLTEICVCCHITTTETSKSLVLVRKLLLRHDLNDAVVNELERFANYIKDMRPKFTSCVIFLIGFEVNNNYPPILKYVGYLRVLMMALSAIMTTVWFISSKRELIPNLINDLSDVDFILYMEKERYIHLNSLITNLNSQIFSTLDSSDRLNCIGVPVFTIKKASENYVVRKPKGLLQQITSFRLIYTELYGISSLINSAFGLPLLISFFWMFISLMNTLFVLLTSVIRDNGVGIYIKYVIGSSIVGLMKIMLLTEICVCCHITTTETSKSLVLVRKLLLRHDLNDAVMNELERFANYIKDMRPTFTACGIEVDNHYPAILRYVGYLRTLMMNLSAIISTVWFISSRRKLIPKLINDLSDVDFILYMEKERYEFYRKTKRYTLLQLTLHIAAIQIPLIVILSRTTSFEAVIHHMAIGLCTCSNVVLVTLFMNLVWNLRCRYLHLNSLILKLNSQIFSTQDTSDRLNFVRVPVFTIKKTSESYVVKKPKGLLHQITSFRLIYTELYGISSLINSAFGLPLLVYFFWMFVSLMNTLFILLTSVIRGNAVGIYMKYVIGSSIVGLMKIMLLTEICVCCHITTTETNKSLVLVRKLLLRHDLNDAVVNELERFANYMKDMRPKFTACGYNKFLLEKLTRQRTQSTRKTAIVAKVRVAVIQRNPPTQRSNDNRTGTCEGTDYRTILENLLL